MDKKIVKQVSSGGFIFYKDPKTAEIFVLLIKNLKDEYWIPKGKLEPGETQMEAGFREINEEVGFGSDKIKYIGFCGNFTYGYDLDETRKLIKDLFINVYEANEKHTPAPTDWNDLKSVDWHEYKEALSIISFTKDMLEKSYDIFIKSK
jgi:8-oxo-dGTP pyrophosphatase MutT (NUDIX family)